MKNFFPAFAFLALAMTPVFGSQEAEPVTPKPHKPSESPSAPAPKDHRRGQGDWRGDAGVSLGRLLEMDNARLARLRGLIEKVEKLPPAERAALHRRLQASASATPVEREALQQELREKIGMGVFGEKSRCLDVKGADGKTSGAKGDRGDTQSRPIRDLLEKHFSLMPPEKAREEKEKFLALSREEKLVYLKALRAKHGLESPDSSRGDGPVTDKARTAEPVTRPAKTPDRDDPLRPAA